ncbi:MAG: RloB family protein, partial [Fusobacteriaceae bacterium]
MSTFRVQGDVKRSIKSASKKAKKVFVIACEGSETEISYFKGIQDNKDELGISNNIEIKPLQREGTKSHPTHVLADLKRYMQENGIKNDELCMVIDRDPNNFFESQFDKIVQECKKNKYFLAITNPCFEFWLLLHFDISFYSNIELLQNKIISNKHNFISKELSNKIRYSKNRLDFTKFMPHIDLAIKNSKLFKVKNEEIKSEL